jgi:hypothetical protein
MVIVIDQDVIPNRVKIPENMQQNIVVSTPEALIAVHKFLDKIIDAIDQDDKSVEVLV